MKHLKVTWKMEPGDGTGCSIEDGHVRNKNGLCGALDCNKPCDGMYGFLNVKFCKDCSKVFEAIIQDELKYDIS